MLIEFSVHTFLNKIFKIRHFDLYSIDRLKQILINGYRNIS